MKYLIHISNRPPGPLPVPFAEYFRKHYVFFLETEKITEDIIRDIAGQKGIKGRGFMIHAFTELPPGYRNDNDPEIPDNTNIA